MTWEQEATLQERFGPRDVLAPIDVDVPEVGA
jgi:hypothetical protein